MLAQHKKGRPRSPFFIACGNRNSACQQAIDPLFEAGHAALEKLPALAKNVPLLLDPQLPAFTEQGLDLVIEHGERWPRHQRLVVIQGDQQPLAALGQDGLQMRRIPLAHLRRQGDQRRPVVQRLAVGDIRGLQGKKVAAPELDRTVLIDLEPTSKADLRLQLLFAEKVLDGLLRQLDTQHLMPLAGQPAQVQALAAQRHQHPRTRRQLQLGPVALQIRINLGQMEADLILFPAFVPKLRLHKSP